MPGRGSARSHMSRPKKVAKSEAKNWRKESSSEGTSSDSSGAFELPATRRSVRGRVITQRAAESEMFDASMIAALPTETSATDVGELLGDDDEDSDFLIPTKPSKSTTKYASKPVREAPAAEDGVRRANNTGKAQKRLDKMLLKSAVQPADWQQPPAAEEVLQMFSRRADVRNMEDVDDDQPPPALVAEAAAVSDNMNQDSGANASSPTVSDDVNSAADGGKKKSTSPAVSETNAAAPDRSPVNSTPTQSSASTTTNNRSSLSSDRDDFLAAAESASKADLMNGGVDFNDGAAMLLLSSGGLMYGIPIPSFERYIFRRLKKEKVVQKSVTEFFSSQFHDDLKFYEMKDVNLNEATKVAVLGCCAVGMLDMALKALREDLRDYPTRKSMFGKLNLWAKFVADERAKLQECPGAAGVSFADALIKLPPDQWTIKSARTRLSGESLNDVPPGGVDKPVQFDMNKSMQYGTRSSSFNPAKHANSATNRALVENGPPDAGPILRKYWLGGRMYDYGSSKGHGAEMAGRNRYRIDDGIENGKAVYVDYDTYYIVFSRAMRRKQLDGGQIVPLVRSLVDMLYGSVLIHFFRASPAAHANAAQVLMETKVVAAINYQVQKMVGHVNAMRLLRGSKITISVSEHVVNSLINEYTRAKRVMFQQSRFASKYEEKFTYCNERTKDISTLKILGVTAADLGVRTYSAYRNGQANGFAVRNLAAKTFLSYGQLKDENWHTALAPVLQVTDFFNDTSTTTTALAKDHVAGTGATRAAGVKAIALPSSSAASDPQAKLLQEAFEKGKSGMEADEFENWLEDVGADRPLKPWLKAGLRERFDAGATHADDD